MSRLKELVAIYAESGKSCDDPAQLSAANESDVLPPYPDADVQQSLKNLKFLERYGSGKPLIGRFFER